MPNKFSEQHQGKKVKKGDPIRWFSMHQFLCEHYQHLSDKLEEYLISEIDQFSNTVDSIGRRSAREDINSWALATLYPNTVRYALFITLYKQFEYTLNEVCLELEEDFPKSVKLSDLKDKGITRAHTYFRQVVGIEEPFEPASWQKIKDFSTLRNIIIHNDAIIKTNETERIKMVQRINVWAPVIIKETRIVLCNNFIKYASQFLYEQTSYVAENLRAAGWE